MYRATPGTVGSNPTPSAKVFSVAGAQVQARGVWGRDLRSLGRFESFASLLVSHPSSIGRAADL